MLSEKELREHFNMPLNEVAKKFSMCTTALKKLCRKYGVMQWPHRKLRSLEKKIASLRAEQVLAGSCALAMLNCWRWRVCAGGRGLWRTA